MRGSHIHLALHFIRRVYCLTQGVKPVTVVVSNCAFADEHDECMPGKRAAYVIEAALGGDGGVARAHSA
jgi:hypothetical protein